MGGGTYDNAAHVAMAATRASLPREKVFRERGLHPTMDPRGVRFRESRDSAAHPDSVGIIFDVDQTGSMGHIPDFLAKEDLPRFMRYVLEMGALRDPQILFMGTGDAESNEHEEGPLQVGQFESEGGLMDQWLTRIYLEGKGGGNDGESYDLALYFAARHTRMDCWEKRGRKGYFFLSADEPHFPRVRANVVKRVIGDELERDIPFKELVEEVSRTFHPFLLIPDLERANRVASQWTPALGDHVISQESPEDTAAVAATLIGLTEGTLKDLEASGKALKDLGQERGQIARVLRAVEPYAAVIGRGGERRAVQNSESEPPRSRRR